MYLRSLTLQGFKSFPEPIRIEFHHGLTAIVGPNGSGKSNITDAIRWVLGEQSARSLRGSKMEDVIFNGTEKRRRLSCAEVSIEFDNRDHKLPIDYETVIVTRKYYRSGESEYLLNGISCRLKDIIQLLADTGIGRDGYSLIGQGKVDDLLSERSEDRRKIFDEAAGIVKFKMRKQEAERKLEKTEQNLIRIHDISEELRARLEPLRKQAEEAAQYDRLQGLIRQLDLALTLRELNKIEQERQKLEEADASFADELNSILNQKKDLYSERESLQAERKESEEEEKKLRDSFQELSSRQSLLAEEQATAGERLRAKRQRQLDLEQESQSIVKSEESLCQRIGDRKEHTERLMRMHDEFRKRADQTERELQELTARLSRREQEEGEKRARLEQLREQIFRERSRFFQLNSEAELLRKQEEEQQDLIRSGQTDLEKAKEIWQTVQDENQKCLEENGQILDEMKKAAASVAGHKEIIRQEEARLHELERDIANARYRLETLKRLEENREGYHQAVKAISKEAEKNPSFGRGIRGPIAELIRVPHEYELAVETALGQALHNIVTESADDASRLISWLKENRAGRETFLPLDQLKARPLNERDLADACSCRGCMGTVASLIDADECYSEVLAFLGGRIIVVDTLEHAREISHRSDRKLRIVTLEGDLVHPGGSMTGGATQKGLSGLLSRSREMDETEKLIEEALKSCDKQKKRIENSRQLLHESGQNEADLREQNSRLERSLISLAEQIKTAEQRVKELARREAELNQEQSDLSARKAKLENESETLREQLETSEENANALSAEIEKTRMDDSSEKEEQNRLREELANVRVSLASTAESIKGVETLRLQLISEQESNSQRRRAIREEKEKLSREILEIDHESQKRDEEKRDVQEKLSSLESQLQELQQSRLTSRGRDSELFSALEKLAAREVDLGTRKERSAQQLERLLERSDTEKNRIWENYRISVREAKEQSDDFPLSQHPSAQKELQTLKQELNELPAINHSAPAEYEELSQRVEFLDQQYADVDKTKADLIRVIRELESDMRSQFRDQLMLINQYFRQVFSELFNGGHAELIAGEGDLLECPIEIKAQPPGKRLQSLSLLSGGERALTAIAIIFAIFKLRPAPFCILDEVESALDEANVFRFTEYLKRYIDSTQFILVTHRRGTMEAADRLYGVSMKERGVSGILSLKLNQEG